MLKHQFRANNRCKIDASIRKDISGHYVNNTQIHCDLWNKIFINFMIYHIFLSNIICTMYKYTCKQYWSYCWNFVLLCACVGWWMRVCVCVKCSVLMYEIITLLKMICNKCVQYYSQWTTWLSYTILWNYFIVQDFYESSCNVRIDNSAHVSYSWRYLFTPYSH